MSGLQKVRIWLFNEVSSITIQNLVKKGNEKYVVGGGRTQRGVNLGIVDERTDQIGFDLFDSRWLREFTKGVEYGRL
jgi:hypothetical protein